MTKATIAKSMQQGNKKSWGNKQLVRRSLSTTGLLLVMFAISFKNTEYIIMMQKLNATTRKNSDVSPNGVSAQGRIESRARVCNDDKKWDAYHLLNSFQSNMHAHNKEDWQVSTYFENLCHGTYLEMGGFDGTTYSNSYAFHAALDWKGVLIEASPTNYVLMKENRPNELANIHSGICSQEKDLHFVNKENAHVGGVNGFVEFAAESFKNTWWSEIDIQKAQVVRCRSLTSVLEEAVGPHFHFDFFSLDVEGAEYEVVKSLNFDLFSFGVIFAEADDHNPEKNEKLRQHLDEQGYAFQVHKRHSDWFLHKNFDDIYKSLKKQTK